MHTTKRQRDTCDHLKHVLGDAMISCEIEMIGAEVMLCSPASSLPSEIAKEPDLNENSPTTSSGAKDVSVTLDNSLSPSHTLVQIVCQDHKGLIYDIMRTLKDYNIQVYNIHSFQCLSNICFRSYQKYGHPILLCLIITTILFSCTA